MGKKEDTNFIISATRPEEAEGATQVFYQTWLATYPNEEYGITGEDIEDRFVPRLSKEGIEKMSSGIENSKENSLFLIAKNGNKVVGVCRARRNDEANELVAIYVLPEYQRQGLGYKFWQEVQKFFDQDKDIIVKVATYNDKAINFYKKLGFRDTGKRFSDERTRMASGSIIPEMEMIIKR